VVHGVLPGADARGEPTSYERGQGRDQAPQHHGDPGQRHHEQRDRDDGQDHRRPVASLPGQVEDELLELDPLPAVLDELRQ